MAFKKAPHGWEVVGDVAIDALVWLDMLVQCNLYQYNKQGVLEVDRKMLRKRYMRSWFLIAFFSVMPVDYVFLIVGNVLQDNATTDIEASLGAQFLEWSVSVKMLRLIRLVRLTKIASLLNMSKIVHSLHGALSGLGVTRLQLHFYFRVMALLALQLFGAHILGCVWLMVGRFNMLEETTPYGWMLPQFSGDQFDVNQTKDLILCSGESFNATVWNLEHGSLCKTIEEAGLNISFSALNVGRFVDKGGSNVTIAALESRAIRSRRSRRTTWTARGSRTRRRRSAAWASRTASARRSPSSTPSHSTLRW